MPTFAVLDANVAQKHPHFKTRYENIFFVNCSPHDRCLDTAIQLIQFLMGAGFGAGDTLYAIGGGTTYCVCSVATSLYLGGVKWKFIPTTITAMSGKHSTRLYLGPHRILGSLRPPGETIIDTSFILTLPSNLIEKGVQRNPQWSETPIDLGDYERLLKA